MYCKNCGKEMNENAVVCLNCGASKGTGNSYCSTCGEAVNGNAVVCLNCGANISVKSNDENKGKKTKYIAGLLAFFFGIFGAHWFYLGYKEQATKTLLAYIVSLVLCLVVVGLFGLIALDIVRWISIVKIFTDSQTDADGNALS